MLTVILSFAVGFVVGALVFRNNKAKAEAVVAKAQVVANTIKQK